jgi:hypothetical protein
VRGVDEAGVILDRADAQSDRFDTHRRRDRDLSAYGTGRDLCTVSAVNTNLGLHHHCEPSALKASLVRTLQIGHSVWERAGSFR